MPEGAFTRKGLEMKKRVLIIGPAPSVDNTGGIAKQQSLILREQRNKLASLMQQPYSHTWAQGGY